MFDKAMVRLKNDKQCEKRAYGSEIGIMISLETDKINDIIRRVNYIINNLQI